MTQGREMSPSRSAAAEAQVTILVVEPDPLVRELVGAGLGLWSERFVIVGAEDPESAYSRAAGRDFDVIVAEVAFGPTSTRGDYLRRLRERAPHAAVIVLTDSPADAFRRGLEYDALVAKPPDIDELAARIERVLARGRRSVVRGIALASFLQVLAADGKSATLEVRSRGEIGSIGLDRGQVVHAETGGQEGREALFGMLRWRDPVLTLLASTPERQTVDEALPILLLEFSVLEDRGRTRR